MALAKNYHGVGIKFVIPEVTPTQHIKEIGDQILNRLEKPIIGLHVRRSDRLNKRLDESMVEAYLLKKLSDLNYSSAYFGTNDRNYSISNNKFFSSDDFQDLLGDIEDNYLLFAIEMYVVDNCDIAVRTFNDSSPFYHINDTSEKNYALCDYSMHCSNNSFRKLPKVLVKCHYEDRSKNNRKSFVKPRPFLPRLIMAIKRKIKKI